MYYRYYSYIIITIVNALITYASKPNIVLIVADDLVSNCFIIFSTISSPPVCNYARITHAPFSNLGMERRWFPRFRSNTNSEYRRFSIQRYNFTKLLRTADMHTFEKRFNDWNASHKHRCLRV